MRKNLILYFIILYYVAWLRSNDLGIYLLKKLFKYISIYSKLVYIDSNALFYQTLFKQPITDEKRDLIR